MKRTKLMLTGIAIMAVVGGSLAFTAKKSTAKIFCQALDGKCTVSVTGIQTANNGLPTLNPCTTIAPTLTRYNTVSINATCPLTTATFYVTAD